MDWRDSVLAARSERIRRRRSRSTSITRTEIGWPIIFCQRCSGVSPVDWLRRMALIWEEGTKPRRPSTATIKPPLLNPMILLSMLVSPSSSFSTFSQDICSWARFKERTTLPFSSSGLRTNTWTS
jgi:hypothetical protein